MSQLDSKFVEKLSSSHKSQVDGFLKFFRRNIEGIKKELTRVFGDEKNRFVSVPHVLLVFSRLLGMQFVHHIRTLSSYFPLYLH